MAIPETPLISLPASLGFAPKCEVVEVRGFEPLASSLRTKRSTN